MSKRFNTIALYTSKVDRRVSLITSQLIEIFSNMGTKVLIPKSSIEIESAIKRRYSDSYIVKHSDLLISIGGDGTLLSAARTFGAQGLPLLGVNVGNIGFLTDISPNDLTQSISGVLSGEYTEDKRFFLEAKINNKDTSAPSLALNEVVIHSGTVAQLIEYDLYIDNKFVYRQKADGIIIATQTGSTAYSLSGNGPIIHPSVDAVILQQMYPHSLNNRPLIIGKNAEIKIVVSGLRKAELSLDSHNLFKLNNKDEVKISISKSPLTLIHPLSHDFYSACRTKLGWSLGIMENIKDE
jgi:NAD+ kinase